MNLQPNQCTTEGSARHVGGGEKRPPRGGGSGAARGAGAPGEVKAGSGANRGASEPGKGAHNV